MFQKFCQEYEKFSKNSIIVSLPAEYYSLGVAEHSGDLHAPSALDVHEVGVRGGDEPLQLVLTSLFGSGGAKEINIHWKRIRKLRRK